MDNKNKNLSTTECKAMYKMLAKYTQVFTENQVKAGCTGVGQYGYQGKGGPKASLCQGQPPQQHAEGEPESPVGFLVARRHYHSS